MSTENTLDRFRKNRTRPTVERDTSLSSQGSATVDPIQDESLAVDSPLRSEDSLIEQLLQEIEAAPVIAATRNIRIDQETLDGLEEMCRKHKITIDNFIVAAFALTQSNERFQKKVIESAIEHYQARKVIARKKRTLTELKKR